jgi:hypothetical protein
MNFKLLVFIMLIAGLKIFFSLVSTPGYPAETPIDQEWWDGLSEEWKTILLINQNFQKQNVDIFTLQNDYINRLNTAGEADYSPMNQSLQELHEAKRFSLSYSDMYARAIRTNYLIQNDSIDLPTLANLETLYMVNGPGDLTPLKKFPHLKVLIINYCGGDSNVPMAEQLLDVEPLKYLTELKVLHCSSIALKSLTPIKDLVNLEELNCDNSSVTSLAPLKNLTGLKRLSFGANVTNAGAISHLKNLEELYMSGCKQLPNLSKLKKLQKLCISESELAIVDSHYRITNIGFLKDLTKLEFLDLQYTSYKGNLDALYGLKNLKAITLPPVSSSDMQAFKKTNESCVIINSFQFDR